MVPENQRLVALLAQIIAQTPNEHRQFSLQKALRSLKSYPLPITSPREAQELDGIGPWVAKQLGPAFLPGGGEELQVSDSLLSQAASQCSQPALPLNPKARHRSPKRAAASGPRASQSHSEPLTATQSLGSTQEAGGSQTPVSKRPYLPRYRSAAYAFLMALGTADSPALDAAQLIQAARPFTDVPLDPPKYRSDMEPQQFFQSGWQSLRGTLLPKGLVVKRAGRPLRYALTPNGWAVAATLQRATAAGLPADTPATGERKRDAFSFAEPLPDGWEVMRTPDGQDYFYHQASKASQWHRPTANGATGRPVTTAPSPRLVVGRQCKPHPSKQKRPSPTALPLNDPATPPQRMPTAATLHADTEVIEIDDVSLPSPTSLRGDHHEEDFSEAGLPTRAARESPLRSPVPTPDPTVSNPLVLHADEPPDSPALFSSPSTAAPTLTPAAPSPCPPPRWEAADIDDLPVTLALAWTPPAALQEAGEEWIGDWTGVMVLDPAQPREMVKCCLGDTSDPKPMDSAVDGKARRAQKRHAASPQRGKSKKQRVAVPSNTNDDGPLQGDNHVVRPVSPSASPPPALWNDVDEADRCSAVSFLANQSPLPFVPAVHPRRLSGPPIDFSHYDFVLVVDTRERVRSSRGAMCEALRQRGVQCESGCLQLGDFVWVARRRDAGGGGGGPPEVVLDFIVERKKMSDLASSIPTGRYHSQKDRLGCSQVGHVMYLVEGDARDQQTLSPKAIASAICGTMLASEFHLLLSPNVEGTILLLCGLTRAIQRSYLKQRILLRPSRAMSLGTWNVYQSGNRQQTVGEVFLRMLQQVHGCSRDKAEAIQDVFPTPSALRRRYQTLRAEGRPPSTAEGLLATITGDHSHRPLGLAASILLCHCFGGVA